MFFDMQKCVNSESVFNTEKAPFGQKKKTTKNALFFLSRAPTHQSFVFNLQFLYELKHMSGISDSVSFLLKFIFVQQNGWTL